MSVAVPAVSDAASSVAANLSHTIGDLVRIVDCVIGVSQACGICLPSLHHRCALSLSNTHEICGVMGPETGGEDNAPSEALRL